MTSYSHSLVIAQYEISVLTFADRFKPDENGVLSVLTGLLVGPVAKKSIYQVKSLISLKSKQLVQSVPAADIFAFTKTIN